MENAQDISDEMTSLLLNEMDNSSGCMESMEGIALMSEKYNKIFGALDVIWSSVQGTESGLIPTQGQIDFLENALNVGKRLWLDLDLGTLQPKWQLTFGEHLLEQVKRYGGLTDKADDTIEKAHQVWKVLKCQFC